VVGDIKHFRLDEPPEPQIYGALARNPFVFTSVAVRAAGDPLKLTDAIRRAIRQVDKDQPVWSIHSFDEVLANQRNGIHWLIAVTLRAYAQVSVLLASIGIFGLMSYAVSQRTYEIGVRMALGARPRDVVKLIARQGLDCGWSRAGLPPAAWPRRGCPGTWNRSSTRSALSNRRFTPGRPRSWRQWRWQPACRPSRGCSAWTPCEPFAANRLPSALG
jgi:hypothetical protein